MEAEVISPNDYVTIPPAGALALTVPEGRALAFFTTAGAVDPILAKIREEIDAFAVPDVKTKKGRDEIKSFAHKITRSKTYLEGVGKELAAAQKEIPKKIDASRRLIKDTLDKWHDEVRAPLTAWEDAEGARVDRHKEKIQWLAEMCIGIQAVSEADVLRAYLRDVDSLEIGPACEEFIAEYASAKDAARARLAAAITAAEKHEAEQAELDRLRKEAAERAAKEREERIAREAAEQARQEEQRKAAEEIARKEVAARAERDAIEAKARAEREEAERRERAAALKAEEERLAAERRELELRRQAEEADRRAAETEARLKREAEEARAREKREAAAREADREYRAKINSAAAKAFVEAGFSDHDARAVVILIASRSIPHVTINY
ncbi:hypothetical protein [Methylosinus sp. Ce-a6]|uniref:hypothetical protein n=1 Tax=Methylosinus sp. Ce-a6 TaxID=2172005 RepID=UPI0019159F11|nr:hypothetical protein [Methylosinus sp. Ce-a6]